MLQSRFRWSLRLLLSVLMLTLLGCGSEPQTADEPSGKAQQALAPGSAAGFVWASSPTGAYPAIAAYSHNSSGGTNYITHLGVTGQYRVDFPGLGSIVGGDVQVTAYGGGGERCKVYYWTSSGSTLQVYINCYAATGAPVNTLFTANYVRRNDYPGIEGSYVWANDPSSSFYTPSPTYSWNSTGGAISISHTPGSGVYSVALGGQNLGGGTVEVTAYGGSNSYCKVGSWGGSSVTVVCFDGSTGLAVDSQFDMIFETQSPTVTYRSNSPNNTWSFSYAWAYSPSTPSYVLSGSYQIGKVSCCTDGAGYPFGPTQAPGTITRTPVGTYNVKFPGLATLSTSPSNVKVTGYGYGSDTCKVVNWYQSGSDAFANVACFNASGVRVDAYFTITYSSFAYTIG